MAPDMPTPDFSPDDADDPLCNTSGRCMPMDDRSGISGCRHCGSEMHRLDDGRWVNHFHPESAYSKPADRLAAASSEGEYRVGEYWADYSDLSAEELATANPEADALLKRSRVVSKRGI